MRDRDGVPGPGFGEEEAWGTDEVPGEASGQWAAPEMPRQEAGQFTGEGVGQPASRPRQKGMGEEMPGAWIDVVRHCRSVNAGKSNPFAALSDLSLADHLMDRLLPPSGAGGSRRAPAQYVGCQPCGGTGLAGLLRSRCPFCNGFGVLLLRGDRAHVIRRS